MLKGEINQKLKWYFKLFDQDGNGKIDKDELETIFTVSKRLNTTVKHSLPLTFVPENKMPHQVILYMLPAH